MTEWSRNLPLSSRARRDESGVTGNWSLPVATVLVALADIIAADPARLDGPTLRDGVTLERALQELTTRMRWSRWQRILARVGAFDAPDEAVLALDREALLSSLRIDAADRAAGRRGSSLRDLREATVLLLDVAEAQRLTVAVAADTTGAVALDLALRVPLPRRSVVQARTLRAIDGDWQVGSGPVLLSTAAAIVLFLAERGGLPPELEDSDEPAPEMDS